MDAIVNAANSTLLGGRGVDGAIHRLQVPDCWKNAEPERLSHREAKITKGYLLPARWVIHTVGLYGMGARKEG